MDSLETERRKLPRSKLMYFMASEWPVVLSLFLNLVIVIELFVLIIKLG